MFANLSFISIFMFRSVANLVAFGCRASLQLVDHSLEMQASAYSLCQHLIFSYLMCSEIYQYESPISPATISSNSFLVTAHTTATMNRSFPFAMMQETKKQKSENSITEISHCNERSVLDKCRRQCLLESDKALALLDKNFNVEPSATDILRALIRQVQNDTLMAKTI